MTEIPDSFRRFLQSPFQRDPATNNIVCTQEEIIFCNLMSKRDSLFIVQEEETKEDVGPWSDYTEGFSLNLIISKLVLGSKNGFFCVRMNCKKFHIE